VIRKNHYCFPVCCHSACDCPADLSAPAHSDHVALELVAGVGVLCPSGAGVHPEPIPGKPAAPGHPTRESQLLGAPGYPTVGQILITSHCVQQCVYRIGRRA